MACSTGQWLEAKPLPHFGGSLPSRAARQARSPRFWHSAVLPGSAVLLAQQACKQVRRRCAVEQRMRSLTQAKVTHAQHLAEGERQDDVQSTGLGKIWAVRHRTLSVLQDAVETHGDHQDWLNDFDWTRPTWENYTGSYTYHPRPSDVDRSHLDLDYHGIYTESRCDMQDAMVSNMLKEAMARREIFTSTHEEFQHPLPCAVFTARALGSGKSFTVGWLADQGLMPALASSVYINPDTIARALPEWHEYLRHHKINGHEMCLKEAGLIAEVALWAALRHGLSVCFDSSLRDGEWHRQLFQRICREHPQYRLTLLHVDVDSEAALPVLLQRAAARGVRSGRQVPAEAIQASVEFVPISVSQVADVVDLYVRVHNCVEQEDGQPYIAALCARVDGVASLFEEDQAEQAAASELLATMLWRPVRRPEALCG